MPDLPSNIHFQVDEILGQQTVASPLRDSGGFCCTDCTVYLIHTSLGSDPLGMVVHCTRGHEAPSLQLLPPTDWGNLTIKELAL